MLRNSILLLIGLIFCVCNINAQDVERHVIQFSGKVVSEENERLIPLPYTNIAILGTSRGTYTGIDGFFSLVAQTGDTVVFSRIGYDDVEHVIADDLDEQFYSWIQIMTTGEYILPEAVILPWPDRDHFKIEFLALDVSDELRSKAQENLAKEILDDLRYTVTADGGETFDVANKQYVQSFQYSGQYKPQNIFSPLAWKQFIDAWRRGDYKKKKDKK